MARVLVVEDNRANMKLSTLLLGRAGHSVLGAEDAETGLTIARAESPDLILMDIQLPGIDGLVATSILKGDPATADIPVIALTAMAMKSDEEKSRAAGCNAYITKPLRYLDLYAAIDALLPPPPAAVDASRWNAFSSASGPDVTAFEPPSRSEAIRTGTLILVAEDNLTNQKLVVRQLALLGFAADVADDGRLALERWKDGGYALLICDLQMPAMDGYELTSAIRAREKSSRHIPILALSADPPRGPVDHFSALGMDGYLSKPLQLADLSAALKKWLPTAVPSPTSTSPSAGPGKTASPSAGDVVDVRVLARLIGSNPAVISEFLADFQASAAGTAMALKAACAARQAQRAGEQAHKLKSSSGAVGAVTLSALCEAMENAGKAGDAEELARLLPLFERELDAVNTFLVARRASKVRVGV